MFQAASKSYLSRKSVHKIIDDHAAGGDGLKRAMGWASLMSLGVGGIIGAGIFVLTGTAAANYAGPGVMISFVLSGLACAFVALCYAELASLIPVSGSTYTYTYVTLGEIFAWIIGWNLVLEYAAGAATVAVGWGGYFNRVMQGFGIHVPPELTTAFFADPTAHGRRPAPCMDCSTFPPPGSSCCSPHCSCAAPPSRRCSITSSLPSRSLSC
ncbi:amino acid permease [Methylocystis sp. SB2]|uniref:amino acid permease n=1 Tax=Methylocystis sp. (strain SB2) TaxID=743836 RepID=UPI00351D80F5